MKLIYKEPIFVIGLIAIAICGFIAGKLHTDLQWEAKDICTSKKMCNNALQAVNHMRDYQLDLHMDTVRIWDGERLVGSYISNWKNQMDTILLTDNQ